MPELARFVPPAETFDKAVYSPWLGTDLDERLRARNRHPGGDGGARPRSACWRPCSAPSISATGFLVTDALCSSCDAAHDALLTMYRRRYGQQGHTVTAEEVLLAWT